MYSDTEITVYNFSLCYGFLCLNFRSFHNLLCKGNLVTFFSPDCVFCDNCGSCQDVFSAIFGNFKTDFHAACFTCGNVQTMFLCAENFAFFFKCNLENISVCANEKVSVFYCKHFVFNAHSDIGVELLCFTYLGRICAVGVNNTVCAETVIACPVVKVAAVNQFAVFVKCLVDVIPDKASLICFVLIFKVGVKLHTA